MKINLNIADFIRRNLPVHMIQPNRIDFYWMIMREIDSIWSNFASFRELKNVEKNITFSKQSLEWWLNYRLYGNENANKLSIVFGTGNPFYAGSDNLEGETDYLGNLYTGSNYNIIYGSADGLENKDIGSGGYMELSNESDDIAEAILSKESDDFGNIDTSFAVESSGSLTQGQIEQINLIVEQYRIAGTDYQILL